ncbi:DNA repair protein rad18 [Fonsecaea multimorphosa]|nr:DNA repair protein rad18 [Fonsecaea multimorphosa]
MASSENPTSKQGQGFSQDEIDRPKRGSIFEPLPVSEKSTVFAATDPACVEALDFIGFHHIETGGYHHRQPPHHQPAADGQSGGKHKSVQSACRARHGTQTRKLHGSSREKNGFDLIATSLARSKENGGGGSSSKAEGVRSILD